MSCVNHRIPASQSYRFFSPSLHSSFSIPFSPSPISRPIPSSLFSSRSLSTVTSAVSAAQFDKLSEEISNGILATDKYYVDGISLNSRYNLHSLYSRSFPSSSSSSSSLSPPPHFNLSSILSHSLISSIDPWSVVASDLERINVSIHELIGSDHPVLMKIAKYFFDIKGKRIRPTVVFLLSRALSKGVATTDEEKEFMRSLITEIDARNGINNHNKFNSSLPSSSSSFDSFYRSCDNGSVNDSQFRLSEICELIHTASLLHDDVIDNSDLRRGVATTNKVFGNKVSILGGDYLLARSSIALSKLRNHTVTEIMSTVIEHLVKGEIMQMKPNFSFTKLSEQERKIEMERNLKIYLTKTFYKTASLIANSCKSVSVLSNNTINDYHLNNYVAQQYNNNQSKNTINHSEYPYTELDNIAYEFGKQLGIGFQIIDDILDFIGEAETLGKESGADLVSGVVTAPVIYAAYEDGEMSRLLRQAMARQMSEAGDRKLAIEAVKATGAINKSFELATFCIEQAVAALLHLKPSIPQLALIQIARHVIERKK